MNPLNFTTDHRELIGKVMNGAFLVLPWERVEDHEVWCDDLVVMADEMSVEVWREPIPAKSITVIYSPDTMPSFDRVRDAISLIEHDRFMTRESRRLAVPGVSLP